MGPRPASTPASDVPEFVGDDPFLMREIQEHLRPFLGEAEWVLHDLVGHLVHLDVHVVPPSDDRPWLGVYTTGMSGRPMPVPEDVRDRAPAYVELMLRLPPGWFGDRAPGPDLLNGKLGWPFRLLVQLGRFPFLAKTHVAAGHGFRYEDEEPFEHGVPFTALVFDPPYLDERVMPPIPRLYGGETHVLGVVPLHPAEGRFHRKEGYRALFEKLDHAGVTDLLDPGRPCVV